MQHNQNILDETYHDVKSLLDSIVKQHRVRYGGHYDDLRADANSLFVEAYDNYDPEQGDFFHWIKYFVWIKLLYARRIQLKRSKKYCTCDLDTVPTNDPAYFDLEDFIGGLSQDAGKVVKLAVNPPQRIQGEIAQGGTQKQGGRPKTMGMAIRRYLMDLGWAAKRITASYNEIRGAL